MTIHLLAARRQFVGNGPRCFDRHYSIIIGGENVELSKETWDAIWAKSLSEKIPMEAAYAAITQIGAAA
jgi:hypothetical protein